MSERDDQDKNSSPPTVDESKVISSGDGSLAAGRDAINNRVASISNDLTNTQINAPLTINNTIHIPPEMGGQSVSISRDGILNAFGQITQNSLNDKTAKHSIINRSTEGKIDQFITSSTRYCFILGPSGTGKSVLMANEAARLMKSGRTVLLLHGGSFNMEGLAETISYKLPEQTQQLTSFQAARLLTEEAKLNPLGLILFIDAIDEADSDLIALELERLHNAVSSTPADKLKVVFSCKDIVWERLRYTRLLSLYEPAGQVTGSYGRAFQTIRVGDFTIEELNRALESIRDQNLLFPGRYGAEVDPHVATLRDLLRHPGTFEHYARLRLTGDLSPILLSQELTWSKLIGLRFDTDLARAAVRCGKTKEEISGLLTRLAVTAWHNKSHDFKLAIEDLRATAPELKVENLEPDKSPFASLLDSGVLRKFENPGADAVVGFDAADAGAYFLSFYLEARLREVKGQEDETKNAVNEWLEQSWNYSPLLDAILALIDRLVDAQNSTHLALIMRTILEKRHLVGRGIFQLISPNAISTLFNIIKEAEKNDYYTYRDAALEIRPSASMLEIVRRHLSDENPSVRQLAVEFVGLHRDEESIQDLIEMLDDDDEDVRHVVYKSFGRIGKNAIDSLLVYLNAASGDGDTSELRSRYLVALRNIGFRNEGISESLSRCLEDGLKGDDELLRSALVTALHLRDAKQTEFALKAISHPNHTIALTAANILAKLHTPSEFEEISQALSPQRSSDGKFIKRYTIPFLLMRALMAADRIQAEPIVLKLIIDGLNGSGELTPSDAVMAAIKLDVCAAFPDILENLLNKLRASSQRRGVDVVIEHLAEVWSPSQLEALAEAARSMASKGTHIAQVFVDALIPGMEMEDEFRLADRLNLTSEYHPVVKCQAADFVLETGRLLQHAAGFNASEICDLLWIAADVGAESALLKKLEDTKANNDMSRLVREGVIRALGTCGTRQGAKEVLNYIHTEERYRISISRESLWPLVKRQYLNTTELINIAEDPEKPPHVRTTCLEVLSYLGAEHFEQTFLKISGDDTNALLQATAVRALERMPRQQVYRRLISLVRAGKHVIVRAQAAEVLAQFGERRAIRYIERSLESDPGIYTDSFAEALAHFQDPTSIPVLVRALEQSPEQTKAAYIEALCSFWRFREGRQAVLEQFEKWSERRFSFFNEQSPLIRGMVRQDANFLLEQVKKHYDDGYITPGALETLAVQIPDLFNIEGLDESLFLQVLERVLCDAHVPSREYAAAALDRIDTSFCRKLYEFLWNSHDPDERRRACAVYTLGFWDGEESLITSAQFAEEWLVRVAADSALEHRRKRDYLQKHIGYFLSPNNLARLSAYLVIKAHGDLNTFRDLRSVITEGNILRTFLHHLGSHIKERLRKDYQDMERKEKDTLDHKGRVSLG